MIVVLAILFGAFAIVSQVFSFLKFKKSILEEEKKQNSALIKSKTSYLWYIIQIVIIIFGFALAIAKYNDQSSLAIAVVIIMYSISAIFTYLIRREYYYNDKGFMYINNFYPYKVIEDIKPKVFSPNLYIASTYSGDNLIITKQHALLLQDRIKKKGKNRI